MCNSDNNGVQVEPGTVMAMLPVKPIVVSVTDSIVAVARTMAGNRTDGISYLHIHQVPPSPIVF